MQGCERGVPHQKILARCEVSPYGSMRCIAVYRNQTVRWRIQGCEGGVPHQKLLARCEVSPYDSMRCSRGSQNRVDSASNDTAGTNRPAYFLLCLCPRIESASPKGPVNAERNFHAQFRDRHHAYVKRNLQSLFIEIRRLDGECKGVREASRIRRYLLVAVYRNQTVRWRMQGCEGGVPHQKLLARCEVSPYGSMRCSRGSQNRVVDSSSR
ncbi:hypothetical protein CEXT_535011 [Caerostris extrusa]|uniref:Uncharacterized protein n=1 Tax=Caerostris extrusa TaxID=172846 RepID=A0AAV4P8F9_CAEEX|nr:hypothetical protein CEXT_535011 [Caerostris extrusa]